MRNSANLGGAVTLGSITAGAASQLTGAATGSVDIVNHSSGASHVDIGLTGTIVAGAQGTSSANSHVSIGNNNGGISDSAGLAIETIAPAFDQRRHHPGQQRRRQHHRRLHRDRRRRQSASMPMAAARTSSSASSAACPLWRADRRQCQLCRQPHPDGDLNAGSIHLSSNAGDLALTNLTSSNGGIYVHDSAGSLTVGVVSATALGSNGANANVGPVRQHRPRQRHHRYQCACHQSPAPPRPP